GSEKYPGENDYSEYISKFSGSNNAFTSDAETCYYFNLANNGLEGALDLFSRFFIDPLFNASSVNKEILAVDSEYKGNIMNDGWRAYQLLKQVTNPAHPFSQFPIGSTETLRGSAKALNVDLHKELLKLHRKYYSADIMKLVVAGNHTLDQLTEWAVSKFSEVKSKGNPKKVWQSMPLSKRELGQLVHMESLGDGQSLSLVFALPELKNTYRTGAILYIEMLLSSQGEGSVYDYLQKHGWIIGIHISTNHMNTDNFNMLFIDVELTPKGKEHRDDIVHAIFAYLQMLSEQGPQKWYYEELRKITNLETYFYEKTPVKDYVTGRPGILHNEYIRPEHVMSVYQNFGDYDAVMISDFLSYLHPDNYMLIVTAKEHKDVECNLTEKYFGTKYRIDRLPKSLTTNPGAGIKHRNLFKMPKPNVYLPLDLEMEPEITKRQDSEISAEPIYLKHSEKMEVWFKKDHQFFTPRGAIHLDIQVATVDTPFYEAISSVYTVYLNAVLLNELQPALKAGLHYRVTSDMSGIGISISGFSEKQKLLLSTIITKIKSLVIDELLFKTQLDMVIDEHQNYRNINPLRHASMLLSHIHNEPNWHYTQVLPELSKISLNDLQNFADHVADQAFFTAFIIGDFEESDAMEIAETVDTLLNSTALPGHLQASNRAISLDSGYFVYQAAAPEENTKDSVFYSTIYCGNTDNRQEAMTLALLTNIIHEPFFDQMRTKEQLGYQVGAIKRKYGSAQYLALAVQGESSPAYTTMRAQSFIRSFRQKLVDFDADTLATKIDSL
ncbi:metalloprotease, partial [Coemansia asiatica]